MVHSQRHLCEDADPSPFPKVSLDVSNYRETRTLVPQPHGTGSWQQPQWAGWWSHRQEQPGLQNNDLIELWALGMTWAGCTRGVTAERAEAQGHLQLHSTFQVSLGYTRPHYHTVHSSSGLSEGMFSTDGQFWAILPTPGGLSTLESVAGQMCLWFK